MTGNEYITLRKSNFACVAPVKPVLAILDWRMFCYCNSSNDWMCLCWNQLDPLTYTTQVPIPLLGLLMTETGTTATQKKCCKDTVAPVKPVFGRCD
jgi:hypothetical protein